MTSQPLQEEAFVSVSSLPAILALASVEDLMQDENLHAVQACQNLQFDLEAALQQKQQAQEATQQIQEELVFARSEAEVSLRLLEVWRTSCQLELDSLQCSRLKVQSRQG